MKRTFPAAMAMLFAASAVSAASITVTSAADSGPGSLRDALANALDGDEVTFAIPVEDAGYDAASGIWTITLTGGEIVFEKSLAIKGGGAIILDGNNANRILYCKSKAALTLAGLAFRNGRAVHSAGKGFGGAVWSRGTLAVTDCVFTDNAADKDAGATWAYSNITATGCAFIRNSSRECGGALYTTFGSVTATDCTFTGNTARVFGGAVYVREEAATIAVAGCAFTGNSTGEGRVGRGGAVCANSGSITATDCTFTGNVAAGQAGAVGAYTTATVTRCVFTANTADNKAGALNAYASVIAVDCAFTGNTARGSGGAVSGGSRTNTVIRCTFKGNTVAGYGGAVGSGALNAADCTFTGNTAGNGGAVSGGMFNATRCAFTANTAGFGGAVHTMSGHVLTATDCVFSGNSADSGGAVAGAVASAANSVFTRNRTAGAHSAAIDASGGIYLYHTTVADNTGAGVCVVVGGGDDGDAAPALHACNSIIAGNSAAVQAGYRSPMTKIRVAENAADLTPEELAALVAQQISSARTLTAFTAGAVTGTSLIEGVTDGVTRAAVFGDDAADANSFFTPLAGGLADKTADALTASGIAVPEGKAAADVIAALRRDITGAVRPVEGKVCYGARE